jgi:hypothetical protein
MENLELITTATYKLGEHRGSARLWIEGLRLFNAGFDSGDRYSIVSTDLDLTIIKTPDGTHKIAGSPKNGKPRPIIDRHDARWRAMFGAKVRADFYNEMIVISRAEKRNQ